MNQQFIGIIPRQPPDSGQAQAVFRLLAVSVVRRISIANTRIHVVDGLCSMPTTFVVTEM